MASPNRTPRHAAPKARRSRMGRHLLLTGACTLTLLGALAAGMAMVSAEPFAPTADQTSVSVPAVSPAPVVPAATPTTTTRPAPVAANPSRTTKPTPTTAKRSTRPSPTDARRQQPKTWAPDTAREAERRLDELKNSGPDSALMKCLQSGKLYEQC